MNLGDDSSYDPSQDIYADTLNLNSTVTPATPTVTAPATSSSASSGFDISGLLTQVGQGLQSYEQATFMTKWIQYGAIALVAWAIIKNMGNKGAA